MKCSMQEFYTKALKYIAYKSALKNLLNRPDKSETFALREYERHMLLLLLDHKSNSEISDFNLKIESYFYNSQFFLKYLKKFED